MISFGTVTAGPQVPQVVDALHPLPVTLSGGLAGLAVAGTLADGSSAAAQFPVTVAGLDLATGNLQSLSVDATGALNVVAAGSITVVQATASNLNAQVVGNVANAAADSGNPVKVGGVFNSSLPTLTNGQRGDIQLTTKGTVPIAVGNGANGNLASVQTPADGATSGTALETDSRQSLWNGASWDRQAKSRANFKLPASAATNNAANIKASPGTIFFISGYTALAAGGPYWLKFFDNAGVPNPAALAQFREYPLVALQPFQWSFPNGLYFPTGIGVAIVQGAADLNNVAVAAGDVLGLVVEFQ